VTRTVLEVARTPHVRSEKDEEHACDAFISRIGMLGHQAVVRFSQPRHTMQTLGIPDRRYRAVGVAFWWEVKAQGGYLSVEQIAFLREELYYGQLVGVGTLDDLVGFTNLLRGPNRDASRHAALLRADLLIAHYTRPAKRAKRANRGKL
jgi:hypothetical protein